MSRQAGLQALGSALDAADASSAVEAVEAVEAIEAIEAVEAVEAVTRELGVALGATKVPFLIADLSDRALVRLAHVQLSGHRRD